MQYDECYIVQIVFNINKNKEYLIIKTFSKLEFFFNSKQKNILNHIY